MRPETPHTAVRHACELKADLVSLLLGVEDLPYEIVNVFGVKCSIIPHADPELFVQYVEVDDTCVIVRDSAEMSGRC